MFSTISWNDYLTGIAFFITGYYILVIALFYRQEIISWLTGNKNHLIHSSHNTDQHPSFEGLEEVVTDVRGILKEAGREADKSILLEQLKLRLANFAGLRQPAFRTALQNYIISQAQRFCDLTFNAAELEEIFGPPSP